MLSTSSRWCGTPSSTVMTHAPQTPASQDVSISIAFSNRISVIDLLEGTINVIPVRARTTSNDSLLSKGSSKQAKNIHNGCGMEVGTD